jgi:hypothetical protein
MTEREKTPFPFGALQVDRSWYEGYWESDPPPPQREFFVGALFVIFLMVSMIFTSIVAKRGHLGMHDCALPEGVGSTPITCRNLKFGSN